MRAPSLLIVQTQWSSASGPSSQSRTRTRHAAPRARPLPRPGGKEMRRWDSKGGTPNTLGGFSCAPRCPASLTFRDSPALLRQESDGYPVRPGAATPTPTSHSPLLDPRSNSSAPTSRPTRRWASAPHAPAPLCPAHTPRPDMHIQDKPGVLLSKETKKWEGGDQRGRLPTYATPQKGAAIAEAVPKHNSQTRSGPGGLWGCLPDRRCTGLSARRWVGCRPCLPSLRQSGTYAAPGKGRARSSTEPRAPNDPGGE